MHIGEASTMAYRLSDPYFLGLMPDWKLLSHLSTHSGNRLIHLYWLFVCFNEEIAKSPQGLFWFNSCTESLLNTSKKSCRRSQSVASVRRKSTPSEIFAKDPSIRIHLPFEMNTSLQKKRNVPSKIILLKSRKLHTRFYHQMASFQRLEQQTCSSFQSIWMRNCSPKTFSSLRRHSRAKKYNLQENDFISFDTSSPAQSWCSPVPQG